MVSDPLIVTTLTGGWNQAVVQLKELDCQGCADNIRSTIGNFDGVESVMADTKTRLVTVVYGAPFTEKNFLRQLELMHFEIAEQTPPNLQVVTPPAQPISA